MLLITVLNYHQGISFHNRVSCRNATEHQIRIQLPFTEMHFQRHLSSAVRTRDSNSYKNTSFDKSP